MQHRGKRFGLAFLALLLGITPCFTQTHPPAAEKIPLVATPNPYEAQLAALQARWKGQEEAGRSATMRKIYGLREYVNDPPVIAQWLAAVGQDAIQSQLARDQARHYAALMEVHAGHTIAVPPLPPEEAEPDSKLPCADPVCTFSALTSAVRADPRSAAAKMALAAYYQERGQQENARDLLRQVIESRPGDFVARMRLAELYASAGLKSSALAEYRRLEAEFPAPLWLKRELAAQYEKLGFLDRALALARAELAQNFDDREARAIVIRILRQRSDAAGLRACYGDMLRLDSRDTHALLGLAELETGAGRLPAAEALLRRAVALAPRVPDVRRQLAAVLDKEGKRAQANSELEHLLEVDPSADAVRRQLAWQTGTLAAKDDEDAPYLVNAAELAREAASAPADDTSNVTALAEIRIERVRDNGLSSVRRQQVFHINSEQGAREYARRTVQYAAGTQALRVVAARLYKPDGRVLDAEDAGDGAGSATGSMYYDARSRTLRFPGLQKGDVIELDYQLLPQSNANPYGRYFGDLVIFRSSLPERLQRYVLITPAGQPFDILARGVPAAEVREQDGRRVYQWELRDTPALHNEPRGPSLTEVAPYVHVSSFATWQQVGQWYAQLIAPQFALDDALRQALSKLLEGKDTDEEKIQAIHQFVLRNTHYVALEFGIYGYKPYPVSQVYARRFGDCKDKASLMIALLRAAGIDADIALVRTRRLGDIDERATSISIFNHAVVYLPKYDLWLDGTAEYAGSRELPLDDQGAMALTVADDGSARMRRIPVTLPLENYTHRQVLARIARDGRIAFTGSAYTRGEDAPGLRREYEVAERQRDSVRDRLAEVLPSVRVDAVQVYGANDLERDVTVNFSGEVESHPGRRSLSLQTSWMPRSYVQTLAALPSRSQDLLLPAPWTTEEELHFVLPAGARLESVPQNKTLETPFGTAVLRYQRRERELVVTTSVQFRKLRITPSDYPAFRSFCAQVESAFRAEIKVGLGT